MKFGDLLNSYIKILGCSAKELAERSGISPALISRYRSGKRTPQAGSLQIGMLAKAIAELAADREACSGITKESVLQELEWCVTEKEIDSVRLMNNLNTLILAMRINVNALAKFTNYDASSICRIRTGKRSPSHPVEFARAVSAYVVKRYTSAADRAMLHNLLGCAPEEPDLEAMITAFLLGKESSGVHGS